MKNIKRKVIIKKRVKNIKPAKGVFKDGAKFKIIGFGKPKSRVGEVHRGVTKYIDTETKAERNYVVVKDKDGTVSVAKLKSIKTFNNDGTNADVALLEIDKEKYGLEKRTGVDFQRFSQNRMSRKPLRLGDKKVFPEQKQRFKLSSHDTHKVIKHTEKRKKPRH